MRGALDGASRAARHLAVLLGAGAGGGRVSEAVPRACRGAAAAAMTAPLRKVEEVIAPLDEADPIARRVLAGVRRMVEREVEKLKMPAPRVMVRVPDAEIMRACRK